MFRIGRTGADICLLLLFAFPLLPLQWSAVLVFPFLLFATICLWNSPKAIPAPPLRTWLLVAMLALPLFYLTELLYADSVPYVWGILQRKLGLIFIPLAFYMLLRADVRSAWRRYIHVLVASTALAVIRASVAIMMRGLDPDQLASGGRAYAFRTAVEQWTDLHPTYFGLLIVFSSLYIMHRLVKKDVSGALKVLAFALLAMFIIFLFLLAARMAIVAFTLATLVLIFTALNNRRTKALISAGLILLVIAGAMFVPTLNSRVDETFSSGMNSTRMRLTINSCSLEMAKAYWLTGVSVERLQPSLNLCYGQLGASDSMVSLNYNTHNEYLNILCAKGIAGLSLFLLILFLLIKKGLKQPLLLSFVIIFAMACLTENLLERQIGVFFFSLLVGLLGIYSPPPDDQSPTTPLRTAPPSGQPSGADRGNA